MIVMLSTGAANAMIDAPGLRAALEAGEMELRVYAGTMPADADNAIGGATLLCTFKNGSMPLVWTDAVGGVMTKPLTDTWSGVAVGTGTAVFARFAEAADADGASTTAVRVQGDVGVVGAFVNLDNPLIDSGAVQTINSARFVMPRR